MRWKSAEEVQPEIYDGDSVETAIIMGAVLMLIVSTLMAMWASYSGLLRYVIMLMAISMALMVPAYLLFQRSARSTIKEPEEYVFTPEGEVEELRGLINRAFAGYRASQAMLEDRLREILLERISIRKRMPKEEVRTMARTKKGAMQLTGDEELAALLYRRKEMGREKNVLFVRPSREYQERMERIIQKMEEWK